MHAHASTKPASGLAQLELSGPLTDGSARSLRRLLRTAEREGAKRVIIDLRGLDSVDAQIGLVLLDHNDRLRRRGGWLWLVHGADSAGSGLRYMGVHDRIRSSPSRAAAGWQGP